MSFVISDEYLPAILTARAMRDDEFTELCAEHPDLFLEMTAEGQLIVMGPRHSLTSVRNSNITAALTAWCRQDKQGVVLGCSGGFVLPNGARRSPDASWVLTSRIKDPDGSWHLCPDFVIELKSKSDSLKVLKKKMQEYTENGAQLGWLIDPTKRAVTIYRPNSDPETQTAINSISGEGPVTTFTLDLTRVWNPLGTPIAKAWEGSRSILLPRF